MLLRAKHKFYYSFFLLSSFAGFSAAAEIKFSSNSERDPCELRSWERNGEGGGSQKPLFGLKRTGGADGKAACFCWSLGAAGLVFGLRHPPNVGLPSHRGASIPNAKATLFLTQHSQKGLGMSVFSREKKRRGGGVGVRNLLCPTFGFI